MAETHGNRDNRLEKVHARAVKRMDMVWVVQKDERRECLDDRRFCAIRGAQWSDEWSTQFENAPKLEIDKTKKELERLYSDYRNNRINVDFRPDDDDGDDQTAEALDGLYRADFEDCGQEALDNAYDEGTAGGIGAWRLRADYEDESDPDNDYQRIYFEPITDADQRVYFDPESKRQDKADAKWCIVLTPVSKEAYEEEYEGNAISSFGDWPVYTGDCFVWRNEDTVYIGEYYEVDLTKAQKFTLSHPVIQDEKTLIDPDEDMLKQLKAEGWTVERERTIKKPKVTKYTLTGKEVIAEELIPGPNIPIIIYIAKRQVVQNIERCSGYVRKAKDPQRQYNALVSQLAEISASSPIERPIFDPEQIDGNIATRWAEANVKRHPYALAKALRNPDGTIAHLGPIGSVTAPQVPQATAALIQIAGSDILDLTGSSEQPNEVPANTSAEAIELVNTRVDDRTFIYLDSFAKAVRRCGVVWKGMAGALYVEEGRKMQAIDTQGGRDYITIGQPAIHDDKSYGVQNLFDGPYRCVVDVGPSSQTRRDATVRSMLGIAEIAAKAGDVQLSQGAILSAVSEMDGEGIDDFKKWIRMRAIQMGVIQPTDEERQEMAQQLQAAQQQPSPEEQLAAAKAQDLAASAKQRGADTVLKLAQANAVGGPDAVPDTPTGLKHVKDLADIGKTAAETENLRQQTALEPTKLQIEAVNAHTNRLKAAQRPLGKSAA